MLCWSPWLPRRLVSYCPLWPWCEAGGLLFPSLSERLTLASVELWSGTTRNLIKDMGMDQYLLIPFLVGWTSIYQLFWCSPGVQGFDTLPYVKIFLVSVGYFGEWLFTSESPLMIICDEVFRTHNYLPGEAILIFSLMQPSFSILIEYSGWCSFQCA